MGRFLFCPLAGHGYVNPLVGIALALRERGHLVAFATGPSFSVLLNAEGIDRIPRGDNDGESFEVPLWHDPLAVAMQVKHVEYAMDRFSPDAIVAPQLTHGPLIAAERHAVPVGVLGFAAYLWPGVGMTGRQPQTESEHRLAWRYDGMASGFNRARKIFGLPPVRRDSVDERMLGDLFMVQSVAELEGALDDLPPRTHLVGACLWGRGGLDAETDRFLCDAELAALALLYVQQGRSFEVPSFWPHLLVAGRNRPVRVVASVGRMDDARGDVPTNFLVRDHVAQEAVLPRADGAICGGNTTAVLGALTHGVPMLLIPAGNEQPDIAERCVRAKTAIERSPFDLDATVLDRALETLLGSPDLKAGAARLHDAFAREDGLSRAATLLERLAETRGPVLRDSAEPALAK